MEWNANNPGLGADLRNVLVARWSRRRRDLSTFALSSPTSSTRSSLHSSTYSTCKSGREHLPRNTLLRVAACTHRFFPLCIFLAVPEAQHIQFLSVSRLFLVKSCEIVQALL